MGTPHYPPDFGSTIKGINDRLRSITTQAQSRRPFTQIKTAILTLIGSLVVKGGGSIKVQDANGNTIVTIGNQGFSSTGATVTGVHIHRANNQPAFTSYSTPDNSLDFNAIYDRSGTTVMSDDGISEHGLATPWLAMPTPMTNQPASLARTNSTSFVGVAFSRAFATHPQLRVDFDGTTDAGTAGQFRLMVSGTQVGPTITVPSGGNVELLGTFPLPGWGSSINFLNEIDITIEAKVTSGTGQIYVLPLYIYGVQS